LLKIAARSLTGERAAILTQWKEPPQR